MAVTANYEYIGVPADTLDNFHGHQIVYACWDQHLLLAAPFICFVTPESLFKDMVTGSIMPLVESDPDFAAVDWSKVEWLKSNEPFTPNFEASITANGIGHKDQVLFRTPNLNTLRAVD
jgi:phenol/toluene 2-monooxygenase (NADH) P4/A4